MNDDASRASSTEAPEDFLTAAWRRVKQHRIAQWTVGYVAVAYGIQHAVTLTSEAFKWPDAVLRLSMLLLILGLPLAMVFAWYHGERTTRRISAGEMTLASLLLVLISLVFYAVVRPSEVAAPIASRQAGVAIARTAAADAHGAISVAVMPFANLSSDKDQEYFSDGMADEISGALAKIPDLSVVARSSSFAFKGKNQDARAIGAQLHATHLIEGSVRKAGNQLRISAELIKADDGVTIWSNTYNRQLKAVFDIQQDIATAIANAFHMSLGLKPGENLVNIRTRNEAVYEDYLRAKALVLDRVSQNGRSTSNLTEAVNALENIVKREPDFAPAWALLSAAYSGLVLRNPVVISGRIEEAKSVVADIFPKSEEAARRAIKLDTKSADGYFALAEHLARSGKYSEAIEQAEKGMAWDPANPDGLNTYSSILADAGYLHRALPLKQKLLALERFVPIYQQTTARVLVAAGQYDAGIKMIEPYTLGAGVIIYVDALAAKGQYREAADALQNAFRRNPIIPATMVDAILKLSLSAPAAAPPPKLPPVAIFGFLYNYVGAPERVMDFYDDALKIGFIGPGSIQYLWTPSLAPVRKTERFKSFMRKIGVVDYWHAKDWPDLCKPVGADDFECN